MKLREQALLKVEPPARPAIQVSHGKRYRDHGVLGWRRGRANYPVSNYRSSWERIGQAITADLTTRSSTRRNYNSGGIYPLQIPSIVRCRTTMSRTASLKPEAPLVIHGSNRPTRDWSSVCKDRWVAIRKENRTCYAQWEDCGPFRTDHFQYVFQMNGQANLNEGAGLDVSPAVRDYLRLQPTDTNRLAICRGAGCAFGSLEELPGENTISSSEAANRAAIEGTEREIRE